MKQLYNSIISALLLLTITFVNAQDDSTSTPGCTTPTSTLQLYCDGANSTPTVMTFDFNNAGQTMFQFTYTIDGGPPVSGSFVSPSNYGVPGVTAGQEVTFTLTWVGLCAPNSLTTTCIVPCGSQTGTPNFAPIAPFCSGTTPPVLAATSPNGIQGSWSPAVVNNTTSGSYIFTPTSPCASTQTLNVTVKPTVTPTFNSIAPVCQNATAPFLPQASTNTPPITGTWSPAVSTATVGTTVYTFTPNPGQCVSVTPVTMPITVKPNVTPDFAPIASFCSGATPPVLSNVSPNGITGTWSPAVISNTSGRSYTFTPAPGQCASTQILTTVVSPSSVPTFTQVAPFCAGNTPPDLPTVSNNGITGVWSPGTINNMISGSYLFTPDNDLCAASVSLQVTVIQPTDPGFSDISFCEGTNAPILYTISPNGVHGTWTPPAIDNLANGDYLFTPGEGQCANPQTITVTIHPVSSSAFDYTVTDAFSENQVITVLTSAAGNYLYQLDHGPLQTSNIFEDVSSGIHSITVYDKNGCSDPITDNNVVIINYPQYFTPNGDGYHDKWLIDNLTSDAKIFIFDRYGKLLKQLSPNGEGWDGTFTGVPMPSADYWFRLQYSEKNQQREFNSHFALKR